MGRQRFEGCERPASVCLCGMMPPQPLRLARTTVVVLQHPHEARHRLSTLPVLRKCIADCHILRGRRFKPGLCELLDFFRTHRRCPFLYAILLFPSPSAETISSWYERLIKGCLNTSMEASWQDLAQCVAQSRPTFCDTKLKTAECKIDYGDDLSSDHSSESSLINPPVEHRSVDLEDQIFTMRDPPLICSSCRTKRVFLLNALLFHDSCRKLGGLSSPDKLVGDLTGAAANTSVCQQQLGFDHPQILLVAVDGTWQHAREMIKASASYLDDFVIPVCLPFDVEKDGSCMADSDSLLRKEPFKGCMTTLEAISCCLKILEPNGTRLHEQLLHTLKCMVQFQASNVVVHKVRMQNNKL